MKKKIIAICILCIMVLNVFIIPSSAAVTNPYGATQVGCITNVQMKSYQTLRNNVQYFTSTITSKIQGVDSKSAIPYETYGAIGSSDTKMFVYSIGKNGNSDFATKTVKAIMEQFAQDNPDWIPIVAINGDFFDIETGNTPGLGEPESPMIQNGSVIKSHHTTETGRGVVGFKADGTLIYHINGNAYANASTTMSAQGRYVLQVLNSSNAVAKEFKNIRPDNQANGAAVTFITPDSDPADLTGMTVYVVTCSLYRYAYRSINGTVDNIGHFSYCFSGTITSSRAGSTNEKPSAGTVYIAVPASASAAEIKVGATIRGNTQLNANWSTVDNAIGFKQAILVNGSSEHIYNAVSSNSAVKDYVGDLGYSVCYKDRTAIGFKADGTPVVLVLKKSSQSGGLAASYYEIAEQLKALGCTNGFLLDGGGSSTMVIRNNSGAYETVYAGENGNTGRSVGNAVILAVPKNSSSTPGGNTGTTEKPTDGTTEKPTSGTTEKPTENTTEPDLNNTFVEITKGNGYVAHTATAPVVADNKASISGYAGFTQGIINSGYYFDNNKDTVKWNSKFLSAGDEAAIAAAGSKAMLFNIDVNIGALEAGEHTVHFMLKLADGTFVIIDSATFTVKAADPEPDIDPDPPVEDDTTTTPAPSAPSSGGCGSYVGLPAILTIALCGGVFAITRKKKK